MMKILRLLGCIGALLYCAGPVLPAVWIFLMFFGVIGDLAFWGGIAFLFVCFLCATFFMDSPNQPATK